MPRPATGRVVVDDRWSSPSYGLRFSANGQRQWIALGSEADGWTSERAQDELATTMALVRRGLWKPAQRAEAPRDVPTFHRVASEWLARRESEGLQPATVAQLRWALTDHLLGYFAGFTLDAITVAEVDRYVQAKVRKGKLGPASINRTVSVLGAVLETALEYELITGRNPARGRRRKLPTPRTSRPWLDTAEHIDALLHAAKTLDGEPLAQHKQRRPMIATLVFGGLRISECLALKWSDVDLAAGRIFVRDSKTEAGIRTVTMLPTLRDEMNGYAAATKHDRQALVFGTSTGAMQGATNVRRRVLAKAIEKANEQLAVDEHDESREDYDPIPTTITPHALRRTAASILFAIGWTAPEVMAQLGHTDARLTLRVYARAMSQDVGEREQLKALVEGTYATGKRREAGALLAAVPVASESAA
jgi:integrase